MPQEKEPKGITRRQFLKGATALGASALLSSCGFKGEPAGEQPTKIPSPTETIPPAKAPTQESSPIPEPTSTPEIVSIPGIILTEEYLKNAFAGIGGEEVITNGQEEVSVVQFGQEYVSQSWGEEINFANLPQSPINSLKYLVSLGVYQGQEGVYFPGKQGEEVVFPQLKDLSFPTLTLEKVPFEGEQREQEHPEWIFPQGLVLRPDTQMTVVGLLNDPKPEGEITVDKGAPGGEPNSVLVAFTDYLRADENNIPRHYLAILPLHFPADPENKNTLSLQNFLKANGYQYDSQTKEITFIDPQTEKQTRVGLNLIEEDFIKDLRQETGLAFVDQMKGELIRNPVVPYPDQMPAVWELSKQEDEKGNISFLLQEENDQGELVPYARAFYDEEKEGWKWQKILSAEEKLAQVPQIEGLKALWQEEKIIYQAEANNPYGLEEGEYAGEFVPNVTMETEEGKEETTGGLVLAAPVVLAELNQQLAKIPEQDDRWLIPLPVDIRGLGQDNPVTVEFKKGYGDYGLPIIEVRFLGEVAVTNVIPGASKLRIVKSFYYKWAYLDAMRLIEPYTTKIYPGKEMNYITVSGGFKGFLTNATIESRFGNTISSIEDFVIIDMITPQEHFNLTSNKILSIGGIPVFVAANTS